MSRIRILSLDRTESCRNWTHLEWNRLTDMVVDLGEALSSQLWPHLKIIFCILDFYGDGLRLLAEPARRAGVEVWAATPGGRLLTTACSEAVRAISTILTDTLETAAEEIDNPSKTDVVDIATTVANTCLSIGTLRHTCQVLSNGPISDVYARLSWHSSVGKLLRALGIFSSAFDKKACKKYPGGLDGPQRLTAKLSQLTGSPMLLPLFLTEVGKSQVLEHLTRSCILASQQVATDTARAGPSLRAVQASLGCARRAIPKDRRVAEAQANVLHAILSLQTNKDQYAEHVVLTESDEPDPLPYGRNVQFFLASHFCAQLRAIEAAVGATQQPTLHNAGSSSSVGIASVDAAGSRGTIYGLAHELLLVPKMRCTEGCADCRFANVLGTDGVRMVLRYWAHLREAEEEEEEHPSAPPQRPLIGRLGRYKLSLRLSKACAAALEGMRADQPGSSNPEAAARSTSGPAAAAAAPARARPLTQKELRKAQHKQGQPKGAKQAAKQQEVKKQDEAQGPSVAEVPEDIIAVCVTGMLATERIHRRAVIECCDEQSSGKDFGREGDEEHGHQGGGSGGVDCSGDGGSSSSSYGSATSGELEEEDGSVEDNSVDDRRCPPYCGSLSALARPADWWKCCLRVLRLLPQHPGFMSANLRKGIVNTLLGLVMWDPWHQMDITGGEEAPVAGPTSSWRPAQEADMAVALPLGLLPCLEELLRTTSADTPKPCSGGSSAELLWLEICRWHQLSPILMRAEWRQVASMVVTMGKLMPHAGARSTLKATASVKPLHLSLGDMEDDGWSAGGVQLSGQNPLYPCDLYKDVRQAAARLEKAEAAVSTTAVATESAGAGEGAGTDGAAAEAEADPVAGFSVACDDDLRLFSLTSLILARWLPAMPRTLQQLKEAGPEELGCMIAAKNLTKFLIDWVPVLCQCYRLARERGDVAAAAEWRQLLLHDADVAVLLDARLALSSKGLEDKATMDTIVALWTVFPAEMAKARAPKYTRTLATEGHLRTGNSVQTGGHGPVLSSRRTLDGQPKPGSKLVQEPLTLQDALCCAFGPGGPISSPNHFKYMKLLCGSHGEKQRLAAVDQLSQRKLAPLTAVARRLQPPHEVLCDGEGGVVGCVNPHCTSLAPGNCEAELPLPHRCGGCGGRMAYCSKACKEAHWRSGHRVICGVMRRRREPVAVEAAVNSSAAPLQRLEQELHAG